jgi:dipeptidyl-peptidase-3
MTSIPPYSLGFPSDTAQSAYYPDSRLSREEISVATTAMEKHGIFLENTRLRKHMESGKTIFEVLQGSIETGQSTEIPVDEGPLAGSCVHIIRGDHATELSQVCDSLREAAEYASSDTQRKFLAEYIASFTTGSLESYRDSQRTWVRDVSPRIENIFGFVEPYRDPHGVRAEWESLVAISDVTETKRLQRLVENSASFIRQLPWVAGTNEHEKNGPFEKNLFEPPDFTSIHGKLISRKPKWADHTDSSVQH